MSPVYALSHSLLSVFGELRENGASTTLRKDRVRHRLADLGYVT